MPVFRWMDEFLSLLKGALSFRKIIPFSFYFTSFLFISFHLLPISVFKWLCWVSFVKIYAPIKFSNHQLITPLFISVPIAKITSKPSLRKDILIDSLVLTKRELSNLKTMKNKQGYEKSLNGGQIIHKSKKKSSPHYRLGTGQNLPGT